jgi:hypothetical protein
VFIGGLGIYNLWDFFVALFVCVFLTTRKKPQKSEKKKRGLDPISLLLSAQEGTTVFIDFPSCHLFHNFGLLSQGRGGICVI